MTFREKLELAAFMALDEHQERTRRPIANMIADGLSDAAIIDVHAAAIEAGGEPLDYCPCTACFTAKFYAGHA